MALVEIALSNSVLTITLNRPEAYNSLNAELSSELISALKQAHKSKEVKVVVLTGAGNAFCAGQDLKEVASNKNLTFTDVLMKRYNVIVNLIRSLDIPVICRLNGVAAGAGASIALACDYIIASENASLVMAFIKVGLVPDSGASLFIVRQLGYQRAFELFTTGKPLSAGEALSLGLVNEVVPPHKLDNAVQEVVNYYLEAPSVAIKLTKRLLNKALFASSMDEIMQWETYYQEIAGRTEDHKEGVSAFLQKRKPNFKGK